MTRSFGCQTDDRCLIWSSLVSRTCKQYFSKQNFVPLLRWLLPELLPPPILWSSRWRRVGTSPVSFPEVRDPWCRSLTVWMARETILWSSFPWGFFEHSHIFGNYHTSSRNQLRLVALLAKSSLLYDLPEEGLCPHVVSADSPMHFFKDVSGFLLFNTSQIRLGVAPFIEFVIKYRKSGCSFSYLFIFFWIWR